MKYFYIIIFFICLNYGYSKTFKLYNEGSEHSVLFSKDTNISILNENIIISIKSYFQNTSNIYNDYYAHYKITYTIDSYKDQTFPLFFIAANLKRSPILININGKNSKRVVLTNTEDERLKGYPFIKPIENENIYIIYEKNQSKIINVKEIIYFEAFLNKGENSITLEYNSNIESNNFGFVKNHTLNYSLSPYKYWKFFGPIHIELSIPENFTIAKSNIGIPLRKKNKDYFYWNLDNTSIQDIAIVIGPKISLLSQVLITIGPSVFISMTGLLLILIHAYFIKRYRNKKNGYNWALPIGNFITPCLFYLLYFSFFVFTEWTLGDMALKKYRYTDFVLFTFPITFIIYALFMWIIDIQLKNKFSNE